MHILKNKNSKQRKLSRSVSKQKSNNEKTVLNSTQETVF